MCASKTSQVLVNYIKKRWQLLHRMTDDKVPITFLIYTKNVHVELEHCVMWCSWHTEEDTITSYEKMSMVKRHTSLERVQNSLKVDPMQKLSVYSGLRVACQLYSCNHFTFCFARDTAYGHLNALARTFTSVPESPFRIRTICDGELCG